MALNQITDVPGQDSNIDGTAGNDYILGLDGDDLLRGLAGNDKLDAGARISSDFLR